MKFFRDDRVKVLDIIEHDVDLLRKQKLMDYSLLLAITYEVDNYDPMKIAALTTEAEKNALAEKVNLLKEKYAGQRNIYVSPLGYVYRMGLIDYLQEFDTMKILENRFKRLRHGQKKMEEVSAIEPEPYAVRFMHFVKRSILSIS